MSKREIVVLKRTQVALNRAVRALEKQLAETQVALINASAEIDRLLAENPGSTVDPVVQDEIDENLEPDRVFEGGL